MQKITVAITSKQKELLKQKAQEEEISLGELMRRILNEALR